MSENLINKEIMKSTENIVEMTIFETKTKEKAIADLILDTEESNKAISETQGKLTLTA